MNRIALLALLVPTVAAAEGRRMVPANTAAQLGDLVLGERDINDLYFARHVVAPKPRVSALAVSKTIFLNKNGVTLTPGDDDSRANESTLVTRTTQIPAFQTSAANWTAVVDCMKDEFAQFDVTVTDVDPGQTPHVEAVFGGSPTLLGMPANVGGVSPFTTDCSVIDNAIVFTFTAVLPQNDPRLTCEIMAQEVAHAYGLDHELLASDPMTYLDYNGNRTFKNMSVSCGENAQRACGIQGYPSCRNGQNSFALLTERLGAKAVTPPPPEETPDPTTPDPEPGSPSGSGSGSTPTTESPEITGGCSSSNGAGTGSILFLIAVATGLSVRRRAHA